MIMMILMMMMMTLTTKSLRKAPGLVAWTMRKLRRKMGMETYKEAEKDDDYQDYEDDEEQHW